MLLPGTGGCPDLVKQLISVPGSIPILPVTIPVFTLCNSLACAKWRGIHFSFQLPKIRLLYKPPLRKSINYQHGGPSSFFSLSLPSPNGSTFSVLGFFLGSAYTNNMKCLELDSGYGLQLCEYSKNHSMVHFKGVNIRVCELYLNKKNTR